MFRRPSERESSEFFRIQLLGLAGPFGQPVQRVIVENNRRAIAGRTNIELNAQPAMRARRKASSEFSGGPFADHRPRCA
jgi:hypothetical protein